MTDDETFAYRLVSEDRLSWLFDPSETREVSPHDGPMPERPHGHDLDDRTARDDMETLQRWEDRLSWLDLEERTKSPATDGEWQEPERDRS